jgi:hypothetical protein
MERLRVEGDNLTGEIVFDDTDEFAKKIKSKFEAGILKMVSAGLEIVETSSSIALALPGQRRATVTKSRLVEVSVVDIGSNADAIALRKSTGEPVDNTELENLLNKDNEMKTFALKLGLPETATEAEILAKIGELQLEAAATVELRKEAALQQQKSIETEVDSAIALKKITSNKREHFVTLGKTSGLELLRATLDAIEPAVKPTDVITPGASGVGEWKKLSEVPADKRVELRKDDVEKYAVLYEAEYGFKPEIS